MNTEPEFRSNIPEFTVSELAFSLKRTVEENYSRVRVRGELSRISIPRSGHLYTSLKDEKSVIDAVCWKGTLSKLSIRPEEGIEVICIGKMTTYPVNSKYQLVIESMELAGKGALLKMLEDRKKKLHAEGLFSPENKKNLPFLPEVIGVITSPTGAVIRDILHRINDRFARHVLIWPVKVQGENADKEITNAIDGFNALNKPYKPDVIIVARGGGSLEDLMAFNEENVVRATAKSAIPIISAVGHETDTTLIDYASDLRAPTPTAAAEKAVPVRGELIAQVLDDEKRLINGINRLLSEHRHKIEALTAKLGHPERILEIKTQHIDRYGDKLDHSIKNHLNKYAQKLSQIGTDKLNPSQLIENKNIRFSTLAERLDNIKDKIVEEKNKQLERHSEKLELLSFENVLNRGYVVVWDKNGRPITNIDNLKTDQKIELQFKQEKFVDALVTNNNIVTKKKEIKKQYNTNKPREQGTLF